MKLTSVGETRNSEAMSRCDTPSMRCISKAWRVRSGNSCSAAATMRSAWQRAMVSSGQGHCATSSPLSSSAAPSPISRERRREQSMARLRTMRNR
jgi:hypothetical protein